MILKKICRRIHKKWVLFLVNKIYKGTTKFKRKRKLLNSIGYQIGEGSKIVGPIEVTGKLIVGENCWIGKNFKVNGNGTVTIGDNCDIAPEVTFQTGGMLSVTVSAGPVKEKFLTNLWETELG